jgi:hypothetical protein
MAFVQVTLLKFKNDTDQSSIDAISEGLKSISNIVPGITKFEFGPDLKIEKSSMDFGLIIVFENEKAWAEYRSHPKHEKFAEQAMKIIERAERVQMQF